MQLLIICYMISLNHDFEGYCRYLLLINIAQLSYSFIYYVS